ncbi:hypothetical protein TorRG33x02_212460 [Trema orientale]|uniref:Uncharacterized protein n=1 Tax=Trema orientale TaxID=63057 RepID=A0A2P5EBR4_TREOI|nr:hypothetical protein TorRG33x02_212460 [Trema orientale]
MCKLKKSTKHVLRRPIKLKSPQISARDSLQKSVRGMAGGSR